MDMRFRSFLFIDVLEKIIDNRGKTCPTEENGFPLIATNCIKNDRLYPSFEKVRYVSQETYKNWFRGHPVPDDMVFVLKGSPGRVNWVPDPVDFCIAQDMVAIRANRSVVEPKYLFALLRSREVQGEIENLHVGSLIPHFKKGDFNNLILSIPEDLEAQKKIGDIYFFFSNKIELNRKMNQTLESMAQAIFKSWFVDFAPVHAKAGVSSEDELDKVAKDLGIPREVLDLFPSEFEESELGLIPKGWRVKKFGECELEIESGKRPTGGIDKELREGVPSVGAESVASTGVFNYSKVKYVTHDFALSVRKGWVQNMDVALYKDGGKPGLFMPRVGLYGESFPFREFMVNEHIFLLRSKQLGQYFLYGLITSENILNQLISCGSAKAAQPGINQTEVKNSIFVLPSTGLIRRYNDNVRPMVVKQLENGNQAGIFQKTRDTLFPKLLSGELDVSNLDLGLTDD